MTCETAEYIADKSGQRYKDPFYVGGVSFFWGVILDPDGKRIDSLARRWARDHDGGIRERGVAQDLGALVRLPDLELPHGGVYLPNVRGYAPYNRVSFER